MIFFQKWSYYLVWAKAFSTVGVAEVGVHSANCLAEDVTLKQLLATNSLLKVPALSQQTE